MWFDRAENVGARQISKTKSFQAPIRGWIRNDAISSPKPGGAEVLDNFVPTAEGCRMRGGLEKHATTDDAVTHFAVYDDGETPLFFATTATDIYDITAPADPDVAPTAEVSSLTSGDFASEQFRTSAGGIYLYFVNGADKPQLFDGTNWVAVDGVSTPAITGVTTTDLSYVWSFKNRLFFVESGTMSAWYLGTDAVGGAAAKIPLGGVFHLGGSLLFGATWSLDSGRGLDDVCLFVSDKGEIAVYEGTDPSAADTWALVGVYRIGRPLGKNCQFKAGGDLAVITDDGIVPISAAVKQDRAALAGSAITYPIETVWRQLVRDRDAGINPFSVTLWHKEALMVVGVPTTGSQDKVCLVANARTGAWARFTGWDTRAVTVFNDKLYFGTASGEVFEGDVSGSDNGAPYSAVVIPRMDDFKSPAEKVAVHARIVARGNVAFTPQLFANADYEVNVPTPIPADPDTAANLWGTGVWGTAEWGSSTTDKMRISEWQTVDGIGHALAPGLQITSGRTTAPDVELIRLDLQYEEGAVLG